MRSLRWGPSAFAVSVVALVLSLGRTGYAVTQVSGSPAIHQRVTQAGRTSLAASKAVPAWHSLALMNGWSYGGFGSYHAAYYKDSGNMVHLRGPAKGGSLFAPAFQLPPRARPSHTLWLLVYAVQGSSGGLEIRPNGQAFLFDANSGANVTTYTSFDGVSFRVP